MKSHTSAACYTTHLPEESCLLGTEHWDHCEHDWRFYFRDSWQPHPPSD